MEKQFQIVANGTSVIKDDFNTLGDSALIDDRLIAEFLRMMPYDGVTVDRAIFPYQGGTATNISLSATTVASGGASGSVTVRPFRAVVGSRTAVATDALASWRDVRSGIWIGSGTSYTALVPLAANSSGSARWDLIYAAITPDVNAGSVVRKIKDPATEVISSASVVAYLQTTVTVLVQTGAPSGSPLRPNIPADGGGTYYIPLAYVAVPNGFNGTSFVHPSDIADVMPVAAISPYQGGNPLRPAKYSWAPSAGVSGNTGGLTAPRIATWGNTVPNGRPGWVIPSDMRGQGSLLLALDYTDLSGANFSHGGPGSIGVLDDSVDWRFRFFRWWAQFGLQGTPQAQFAFDPNASGPVALPTATLNYNEIIDTGGSGPFNVLYDSMTGMGQSILSDGSGALAGSFLVAVFDTANCLPIKAGAPSAIVSIFVDGTGRLCVLPNSIPAGISIFMWLDYTGIFPNL